MKHLFSPAPDQILYHYTTVEGARAILRNNSFRLSEFSKMNDASEYNYSKTKFVEAYQNRKVRIEETPRFILSFSLVGHESETLMMIGCLTEDHNDAGLWDRYADRGGGCVLGLDAFWLNKCAGVAMRRVSYDPEYLSNFVNSALLMLQGIFEKNATDREQLQELARFVVMDLYAFKDPRFRSEMEVRISRLVVTDRTAPFGLRDPGGNRGDGKGVPRLEVQQRRGRFGLTRYVDLPLWDDATRSAIKSVCFGPSLDPSDEDSLREAASGRDGIAFSKSDLPLR
jgi:hypothetical protein